MLSPTKRTWLAVLTVTGILAGFFLSAAAVLVVGLAIYGSAADKPATFRSGWALVGAAWPLLFGAVFLSWAGWLSYRALTKTRADSSDAKR